MIYNSSAKAVRSPEVQQRRRIPIVKYRIRDTRDTTNEMGAIHRTMPSFYGSGLGE